MSKASTKQHLSADAEDKFEEKLERGNEMGDLHDWGAHLGMEILSIESKIEKSNKSDKPNKVVIRLLEQRLSVYNAALLYLDRNPKGALALGSSGGVKAIISYICKKAQEQEAEAEMKVYIDAVRPKLPGARLNAAMKAGGFEEAEA
jgi:hypothetical protein